MSLRTLSDLLGAIRWQDVGGQSFSEQPSKSLLLAALRDIADIPGFSDLSARLLRSSFLASGGDILHGPQQHRGQFQAELQLLSSIVAPYTRSLEAYLADRSDYEISVCIPEGITLAAFVSIVSEVEKIAKLTVLSDKYGGVTFSSLESGSAWWSFALEFAEAHAYLSAIIAGGIFMWRRRGEVRLEMERARSVKLRNDRVEALQGIQQELLDHVMDSLAEEIRQDTEKEDDEGDRLARIKTSISMVSDLLDRSVRFEIPPGAPEKSKRLLSKTDSIEGLKQVLSLPAASDEGADDAEE